MKMKKVRLHMRIDPELKAAAKTLADAAKVDLTAVVEEALRQFLRVPPAREEE